MKVLVVDDDKGSRMVAAAAVEQSGHECITATDGDAAWALYQEHRPHVVVTDRNMPGLDGLSLCRAIRNAERDSYTYLVLLTSHGDRDDVLAGMAAGADDYVTKPYSVNELMARIKANLRRLRPAAAGQVLEAGDIRLDAEAHKVFRGGRAVHLGPTEFRLLAALLERPGKVWTREALLDQHRAINAALQARDPQGARQAVEAHLSYVEAALHADREAEAFDATARQRLEMRHKD